MPNSEGEPDNDRFEPLCEIAISMLGALFPVES